MTMIIAPIGRGTGGTGGGSGLSVTVTPLIAYGARSNAGGCQTENVAVYATGGSGSYTYLWSLVSAVTGSWSITASTSSVTKFSAYVGIGDDHTAYFKCTVSDGVTSVASATIEANVMSISYL